MKLSEFLAQNAKYRTMLSAGVPKGAVLQKIITDGKQPKDGLVDDIVDDAQQNSAAGGATNSAAAAAPTSLAGVNAKIMALTMKKTLSDTEKQQLTQLQQQRDQLSASTPKVGNWREEQKQQQAAAAQKTTAVYKTQTAQEKKAEEIAELKELIQSHTTKLNAATSESQREQIKAALQRSEKMLANLTGATTPQTKNTSVAAASAATSSKPFVVKPLKERTTAEKIALLEKEENPTASQVTELKRLRELLKTEQKTGTGLASQVKSSMRATTTEKKPMESTIKPAASTKPGIKEDSSWMKKKT